MPNDGVVVCEQCGKEAVYGYEPACRACGYPETKRAPNVLIAASQRDALLERYEAAVASAAAAGCETVFARAEALAGEAKAVVNVPLGYAFLFLSGNRTFYLPYALQTGAGSRAPAAHEDDRRRRITDTALYGAYGAEINFACLSPDGRGLRSYGEVCLELDPATICFRTSVLEENSFRFHERHGENPPPGHLAAWDDRGRLAAVKVANRLRPDLEDDELGTLLLSEENDRATDEFIELHVYGRFNAQAVAAVRLPRNCADPVEQGILDALRASLAPNRVTEGA